MDYLHFFYFSELIVKLLLSQVNILCNLCPFNIREFVLKESVISYIILLNPHHHLFPFFFPFPSLCLAYHVAPPPLTLFLLLFLSCLSYYPYVSFLLFALPILLPHTLFFFPSFLSCCHTCPFSFFSLPILPHIPSSPFLL